MVKKFAIQTLLFFIPVIIICVLLEKYTRDLSMPYSFVAEQLEQKADSIKAVAFGSSQMKDGLNAEWLSVPSINLASGNQHLDIDFKLYRGLKERLTSLETVIIEVSYAHFEMPHNGRNFWKNSIYLEYYDVNCFERNTWYKDRLIYFSNPPFYSDILYKSLRDLRTERFNSYGFNTNNFEGSFKSADYDEKKIATYKFQINTKVAPEIFKKNVEHFILMLDTFRNDKIKVLIVTPPMYKEYLAKRNPEILKRRDSILFQVRKQYDNVEFLLLEEDTLLFETRDFLNHNHLNPRGARKLATEVNKILEY
jgi:hypothetical protein